jgi:hypothetical protein
LPLLICCTASMNISNDLHACMNVSVISGYENSSAIVTIAQ